MNGPGWCKRCVRSSSASLGSAASIAALSLAALFLIALASDAFALQRDTWQDVSPSLRNPNLKRKAIGSGYFWNKDRGLLGSGIRPATWLDSNWLVHPDPCDIVSIYYTTDGGTNWDEAVVPVQVPGAVTQICMVDSLVGYASIFSSIDYSYYRSWGASALWKTTDGGRSWFDPYHLEHLLTCVYAQQGLLLFTQWDSYYSNYWAYPSTFPSDTSGGNYSFDDGVSWQRNFRRGNGIAFSDSLNGVVTEMNVDSSRGWGMNFWATVDAGRTWYKTANMFESWSVYAVQGQKTYFTAGESQYYLPHTSVYRSNDGGFLWREIATFPEIRFTGTINGKGSTLYVQTDSQYYQGAPLLGMYRSDDLGETWHWIGGPANARDTRFVVTGCSGEVVYAFDGRGGVWKTEDGGDGTLEGGNPNDAQMVVQAAEIAVTPHPCGDSLAFSVYSTSCTPVTIDSIVQVVGTELIDRTTSLPRKLLQGDSLVVQLAYQPLTDSASVSVIRVFGHAGKRKITQDVKIDLEQSARTAMILSSDSIAITTTGCSVSSDSVYVGTLGCPGMILDSLSVGAAELHCLSTFPDTLAENRIHPIRFLFAPDSSGAHTYYVRLHGHFNRRILDTTLVVTAVAARGEENWVLSDSLHHFDTKYCNPEEYKVQIGSTSCDSVWIDSVSSTSNAFVIPDSVGALPSNANRTLRLLYDPNAIGSDTGVVHIHGHSRTRSIDTTIMLYGINRGHTEPLELSDTTVQVLTAACQPSSVQFTITNQCCNTLIIDTVYSSGSEVNVSYDRSRPSLASNDTLPISLAFSPDSGGSRRVMVHIRAHSAGAVIDTTISVDAVNAVSSRPLRLAFDTVYLPTKYCHPVDRVIGLSNLGCPEMVIDSVRVFDDARGEFSIPSYEPTVASLGAATMTIRFDPDTSGRRSAHMKIYSHLGDQNLDTTLTLIGRNFTSPEPFLLPVDSGVVAAQEATPIYFRPTTDTFAIHGFTAHLSFNTDILTPRTLSFEGSASPAVTSSNLRMDASGAWIDVLYVDSLRDTANLTLPVVRMISDIALTKDLTTPVVMDRFSTDVEPALTLCSVPSSAFVTLLRCGDPTLVDFMRMGKASLRIKSVQPNPVSSGGSLSVTIVASAESKETLLEIYDMAGSRLSIQELGSVKAGVQNQVVTCPSTSGDYFLVLRTTIGIQDLEKVSVVH
jgi:hypothetical protein